MRSQIFSKSSLLNLADTQAREENYFDHLTGFNSYAKFQEVLKFVLPGGERKNIVYWNMKVSKNKRIDTSLLFDSDEESAQSDGSDSDSDSGTRKKSHFNGRRRVSFSAYETSLGTYESRLGHKI